MAWKRGVSNNAPGATRLGHIKEFQMDKSGSVSSSLRIVSIESLEEDAKCRFVNSSLAYICTKENGLPVAFHDFVTDDGILYMYAHQYPRCILTTKLSSHIPFGCIAMSQHQMVNSRICATELEQFTLYSGESIFYDCREASMGTSKPIESGKFPRIATGILLELSLTSIAVKNQHSQSPPCNTGDRSGEAADDTIEHQETLILSGPSCIDAKRLAPLYGKSMCGCIVSTDEVYAVNNGGISCIARVLEIFPETENGNGEDCLHAVPTSSCVAAGSGGCVDDHDTDLVIADNYRGVVDESTHFYFNTAALVGSDFTVINNDKPPLLKDAVQRDMVTILCNDMEEFPVKRKLLRPCIALTSIVQSGKGIYICKDDDDTVPNNRNTDDTVNSSNGSSRRSTGTNTTGGGGGTPLGERGAGNGSSSTAVADTSTRPQTAPVSIDVDACTFDRVLLYLEHEARGEPFIFDPLLATELRTAAITLKVSGLIDLCDKVLGSFQDRVRKQPIRLDEVIKRNNSATVSGTGKCSVGAPRVGETLLLLNGMVLDVSRWLPEHPGGSTTIPNQSLNVDCSVFFEIYHASRQSFLYLKEFYIGELALEDRERVRLPRTNALGGRQSLCAGTASPAFLEQLDRFTSWRLNVHDMPKYEDHKSF